MDTRFQFKNNPSYILGLKTFKLYFNLKNKDTFLYNAADSTSWSQWDTSSVFLCFYIDFNKYGRSRFLSI
jgi:hypothetical protein